MDKIAHNKLIKENKELLEWKRRLSLMLKYSSEIKISTNVNDILNIIADVTNKILLSDRTTVFLLDKEKNELFSWVAHGIEGQQIRFSANKGLAGYVAKTGKILNIEDAYKDKRFNPQIDKITGYRTKTILCMPMKNQMGETIGVFEVLNKNAGGVFLQQDEEILRLLSLQAASSIESTQLYEELEKSFSSFINTLAEAIDARDPMTAGHSRRVCHYSVLIAEKMGCAHEKVDVLKYAALLHDLGKIGIRESILTKQGRLTDDEYRHIQTHAEMTRKILECTYFQRKFKDIPVAASSHHENIDGSGYPNKLKGKKIPVISRILSVADVFDALTYIRHYRNPISMDKVIQELRKDSGKKFDPVCINGLLNIKIYDILKIMTNGTDKQITKSDQNKFNNVTLKKLEEIFNTGSNNGIIKAFNKYYPAQFNEN